jgi:hypothetical protein
MEDDDMVTAQFGYAEQLHLNATFSEAANLLASGKSARTVAQQLVQNGVPAPMAEHIVAQAAQVKRAAFRKAGLNLFLRGIGLIILGIIVTSITYSLASPGGIYLVAFGPVIAGVINAFRGLLRMITG